MDLLIGLIILYLGILFLHDSRKRFRGDNLLIGCSIVMILSGIVYILISLTEIDSRYYGNIVLFFAAIGIIYKCSFFFIKSKQTVSEPRKTQKICPDCQKLHTNEKNNLKCENCNSNLEPLAGFFDRNPDLLTKSEKSNGFDPLLKYLLKNGFIFIVFFLGMMFMIKFLEKIF